MLETRITATEYLSTRLLTPPPSWQTERAATRVKTILAGKDVAGVRLGVRRRGCNGLSYTMEYAETVPKGDEVVDKHGEPPPPALQQPVYPAPQQLTR